MSSPTATQVRHHVTDIGRVKRRGLRRHPAGEICIADDRSTSFNLESSFYFYSVVVALEVVTIRKNKQSVSTAEGSSSHLNRTESSHSNNVGSAFSMIPCFPASNGTDVHHRDTISNHSSPSHFSPSNLIFPKSEPGQLQTIYATAWKITKIVI